MNCLMVTCSLCLPPHDIYLFNNFVLIYELLDGEMFSVFTATEYF